VADVQIDPAALLRAAAMEGSAMLIRRKFLRLAAGGLAVPVCSHIARAQSYPSKPVRLVVGFPAGGTGDILTGMLVGVLAQEYLGTFVERLCLAVYLHGLAGDLAAEELGEESIVATDLLRFLPQAWENLRHGVDLGAGDL